MSISTVDKTLSKIPKLTPMVRFPNRTIGVNLGIFTAFFGSVSIDAAPLGLGSLVAAHFYTDAVPLGLKRWLAVYNISVKIRCGWETAP